MQPIATTSQPLAAVSVSSNASQSPSTKVNTGWWCAELPHSAAAS